MRLNTLQDLFLHEMQDLYSAEKQITKALPKMMKAASNPKLKTAFEEHLKQTEEQIVRLESIAQEMNLKVKGKKCKGMEGLIEEGQEMIKEKGEPDVKDAALIGAAQRVEHYEIAGYGCAITYAKLLGYKEAVKILKLTIDEEETTDKKLSKLAESEVNKNAKSS